MIICIIIEHQYKSYKMIHRFDWYLSYEKRVINTVLNDINVRHIDIRVQCI